MKKRIHAAVLFVIYAGMSLLKRIPGIREAVNRYEAAFLRFGERSLLNSTLQSARFDIDQSTRQELQRKHRYWVANSSLVQRIRNLFIQFSVGVSGLQVVPNSEDEEWNHGRQHSWQEWCESPEVDTNAPMSQLCIKWAGALFDDGEVFVHKTRRGSIPALETFEAHRVQTPQSLRDDKSIIDGIKYEVLTAGLGRPISYFVSIELNDRRPIAGAYPTPIEFVEIPARDMWHIFKARRPGQLRGIPEGFACMNTLHDYEDLHLLEMQVAKQAAQIGNVETNPTGEVDIRESRRAMMSINSLGPNGAPVVKNADQYYKVTLGAQTIALKAGDSIKQFQVDRPSLATQQYWDLKITEICCGYNVPKLLVVPYSLQGTVTRADLDVCANAFRFNFELIASLLEDVYEWQTDWAVKFDRSMDGKKPQMPLLCRIQPPRAPNVDIGYTAAALEIELRLGTKTLQDTYAERQQDWRHQLEQIAETEAYINQLAEKFDLDPNRISQKIKEAAAKPEPDEDDQPSKAPATKEDE